MEAGVKLDIRGKTITTFIVYELNQALAAAPVGEVVEVVTDPFDAIEPDIEAWCEATGHRLLETEKWADQFVFFVERRQPMEIATKMAIVISDPGLEELLSPLSFALGAALEGMHVHMFIQGPAVRILKRGYQPRLKGWYRRPFSGLARRGMAKQGHVSPQEKLLEIRELGGEIYMCGGSMDHFNVRREDLIFGDVHIVEYLSFVKEMADADIQLMLQ
jgi:predicted peroxiredoxin/TusA-related sulfurtransferase